MDETYFKVGRTEFKVERTEIKAIPRKLRANWTLELMNDIKFLIDEDVYSLMADEIALEVDGEKLDSLIREEMIFNDLYERFKFKKEDFAL